MSSIEPTTPAEFWREDEPARVVWRDRGQIIATLTAELEQARAENERLRAEVERLRGEVAEGKAAAADVLDAWRRMRGAAFAAEAKLRDVEALLRLRERQYEMGAELLDGEGFVVVRIGDVRAVLARSQAPQAPAEQEYLQGHYDLDRLASATADDEGVRRG